MTASQAEKLSALVSEVSLHLSKLTSIAKQLENDDVVERLNDYRDVIEQISKAIEQSEYSGLYDLISILVDGIDTLIEQSRNPTQEELYFLNKLPDKILDYISYPSSKLPGLVLLRLFKHQGWIRPISDEEEKILTEFILPVEMDIKQAVNADLETRQEVQKHGSNSDNTSSDAESFSLGDLVVDMDAVEQSYSETDLSDSSDEDYSERPEIQQQLDSYKAFAESSSIDSNAQDIESAEIQPANTGEDREQQQNLESTLSFELDEPDVAAGFEDELDEEIDLSVPIEITDLGEAEPAADVSIADEPPLTSIAVDENLDTDLEEFFESSSQKLLSEQADMDEATSQSIEQQQTSSSTENEAADDDSITMDMDVVMEQSYQLPTEDEDIELSLEGAAGDMPDDESLLSSSEDMDTEACISEESVGLEINIDDLQQSSNQAAEIESSFDDNSPETLDDDGHIASVSNETLVADEMADVETTLEILAEPSSQQTDITPSMEQQASQGQSIDDEDLNRSLAEENDQAAEDRETVSADHNNIGKDEDTDLQFGDLIEDDTEDLPLDTIELDAALLQEIDETPLPVDNQAQEQEIAQAAEASIDNGLSQSQQELVDLVRAELAEIIDERNEVRQEIEQAEDETLLSHHLMNISEQAENISNAVNLIGLEGMAECALQISKNIHILAEQGHKPNQDKMQLLYDWPVYLLGVLQDIYARQPAESLVEFLSSQHWPKPLSSERRQAVIDSLQHPDFAEEEVEQRQKRAEADDVSLQLPEDVNMELLEGLLQDLPSQTEEFSSAMEALAQAGDLTQLDVAQRIAHTLKGAANVVGVRGIANLTHHLEDILQVLTKAGKRPSVELQDLLVSASDCLEAMSETLLGLDEPPEDAQQVLQDVLDWANRLDNEGLKDEYTEELGQAGVVDNDSSDQQRTEAEKDRQQEKDSISSETMLRIPTRLADDMLRLAGENLISNVQVQSRIHNTIERQEALRLHNQALQQLSSDLEHLIDIQGITSSLKKAEDDEFDPLEMDQYHELHSVSRRLVELTADSVQHTSALEQELADLKDLIITQDQLHKENQELVERTRMVPIRSIIPRLKRGVRQACRTTGKNVELVVNDNDASMDSEVLNGLIEPLMHLLRNAVDHGIEPVEERQKLNKPESGRIQVDFVRKGDQIVITIRDDGRGLDEEHIRMKAVENNLIKPDQQMLPDEIRRLILEPGFTTRQGVTHISGRGIGLDVVNVKIRDLKGSIAIKSRPGRGCNFELTLPVSSFSTHSLLVRVREYVYAISNRGIVEILYPGAGEISDIGDETVYQLGDQTYRTLLIDTVLGLPHDRRRIERMSRPVILVQEESGARTAIMVQEILSSIDVVVKPMGRYLPKVKGIIGATVLGDGSIAPVVDLPEMLFESSYRQVSTDSADVAEFVPARLPYVLVVDDSLSARQSLAQFVEDLGLEVRTARDGMEAVSLIEVRKPDLILADMEMPKMNGLELTSHVRASDNLKNLPIIMITSRSTEKHRKAAKEKGVNHFLVKPFNEDELAEHIHSFLEAG